MLLQSWDLKPGLVGHSSNSSKAQWLSDVAPIGHPEHLCWSDLIGSSFQRDWRALRWQGHLQPVSLIAWRTQFPFFHSLSHFYWMSTNLPFQENPRCWSQLTCFKNRVLFCSWMESRGSYHQPIIFLHFFPYLDLLSLNPFKQPDLSWSNAFTLHFCIHIAFFLNIQRTLETLLWSFLQSCKADLYWVIVSKAIRRV